VVPALSLAAARIRLVACVLAALCVVAAWCGVAAWCVVTGAAALTVCDAVTACHLTGATCELKLIAWVWTTVTCELKPDDAWSTRACADVACASAQCEPPRPSAPATPKTAAPAALISATEHSHLLRSMIVSRHRVIAAATPFRFPGSGPSTTPSAGGGYSPS